jgi:hypothetical protein
MNWLLLAAAAVAIPLSGCAEGTCATCPTAQLTANGSAVLDAQVGDEIAYAWSSINADVASSTVAISPTADACGNSDGPWVVSTLDGSLAPQPLLACQSGFTYTLTFTVQQSASGDQAESVLAIVVH